MKEKLKSGFKRATGFGAPMFLLAPTAFAQQGGGDAIDVTSVVSKITAQAGPIASIGAAVLGIIVAIKAYQWIRRSMS